MGYRTYIGIMPKNIYDELKTIKSIEDFFEITNSEEDDIFDFFRKCEVDQISDWVATISDSFEPFFIHKNKEVQLFFKNRGYLLKHLSAENFKKFILLQEQKIVEYYKKKLQEINNLEQEYHSPLTQEKYKNTIISEIQWIGKDVLFQSKIRDEQHTGIINLNENQKESICTSWLMDYNLLELVHQYKYCDFDNLTLFITGH